MDAADGKIGGGAALCLHHLDCRCAQCLGRDGDGPFRFGCLGTVVKMLIDGSPAIHGQRPPQKKCSTQSLLEAHKVD